MNLIECWAQRRPTTRWPVLLLGLLLLVGLGGGITGCGGNDGPEVLATAQSDAQGGDANTGAAVLVLPLPGPVVELATATVVRVRISARLHQRAHYTAAGSASLALREPTPTAASAVVLPLAAGGTRVKTLDYAVVLRLPAGRTRLLAWLTVRAADPANGLPTGALGRAEVMADWVVERQP